MVIEKTSMNSVDTLTDKQAKIINSRNKTLDVYKGVLIILVVLGHALKYSVSDGGGILLNFIWAVQMPGFMLVSGYFAARRIDDIQNVGKRILLSAQHYVLPFFTWFLLAEVALHGKFGRNPFFALSQLINRVDTGLWFLWAVFVLSIVAAFANFALSSGDGNVVKTGTVLVICFGMILGIAKIAGPNFLGIKYILYYAIFYGFGWLVKLTENWWTQWWPKVGSTAIFLCLIVFLGIVLNFDLYHNDDGIVSIAMRIIAGFTGNAVILTACKKYESILSGLHLDWLGMYTLEIYATHMCVNNLMEKGQGFFTAAGFGNFICSIILTAVLTTIIIAVFKSNPVADFVFYGKKQKEE